MCLKCSCQKNLVKLRIIEIDGKPYFCGIDVAKALGYSNPRDAIGRHCRVDGVVKRDTINSHKTRNFRSGTESEAEQVITLQYITEGNVYRLIARSKLKEAIQSKSGYSTKLFPQFARLAAMSTMPNSLWPVIFRIHPKRFKLSWYKCSKSLRHRIRSSAPRCRA